MQLKPIGEQVAVILGAASGIGRETALRFAQRGARVVVAARDPIALATLVAEITRGGGLAIAAVCDVTDAAQVDGVAVAAVVAFGRIDTWVNVAAVSVYARFEAISSEEFRRVLDVNVMGQVHGARAALPALRLAGGGALISISSVEGRVALPLNSAYAASKFAVEGFLEALRRELLDEGAPISVTSVKPATVNTPFFDNARSKIGVKPKGPPPIYQPDVVADCVLYAAEHPVRDLYAGGAARAMVLGETLSPSFMDAALSRPMVRMQRTDELKPPDGPDNLFAPRLGEDRVEGDFSDRARRFSLYTWLETHPRTALAAGVVAGTALMLARGTRGGRGDGPEEMAQQGVLR
jgi:NAD(P)-dependent dehydrogenase (short-subunit alcohol dehydrogenase family)